MEKKISIFINSITFGGAERVVSLLLPELRNSFDIWLVLLQKNIEYDLPADQKIFCFNQPEKQNALIKLIKLPFLAYRYKKFCRKNNIEVSISFLKRANYINCLSGILGSKCRIIVSERTYLSGYLNFLGKGGKASGSLLTRWLYNKANLIVANSDLISEDLRSNFNISTESVVINNPVNLASIQKLSSENVDMTMAGNFCFISVGGLRREKNYELLIESFAQISELDCDLILIGKGEEENRLKQRVKELKLGSRVFFPGFDNNPYKYMAKADCFVLSSDFEGFPNSIQEALACNLPIISTDCRSGPREILAPGTDIHYNVINEIEIAKYGILVPVKNVELMAKAMRLIYNDSNLRKNFSSISRERACSYDLVKIADQFKKILADPGKVIE